MKKIFCFFIVSIILIVILVVSLCFTVSIMVNGGKVPKILYRNVPSLSFYEFVATVTKNPKIVEQYFVFDVARNSNLLNLPSLAKKITIKENIIPSYHKNLFTFFGVLKTFDMQKNILIITVDGIETEFYYQRFSMVSISQNIAGHSTQRPSPPVAVNENERISLVHNAVGKNIAVKAYRFFGNTWKILDIYL